MATHLERILSAVRETLEARKASDPFAGVAERATRNVRRRGIRLGPGDPPGIIAEIKRASPSRGWIRKELDAADTARAYVRGGACAVSVLTESRFFGGSLADLSAASAACGDVPALRKDFLLDDYMIAESRSHGADLVLLIVAVLGKETGRMLRSARAFGMEALVEVHDEAEMDRAARLRSRLIGVNNRDLKSFTTDLAITERLAPLAPERTLLVGESGIGGHSDCLRLARAGVRSFLVGESLMRQPDIETATRQLLKG
jgi:indole-3-glycerol phosphate synthase